MILVGPNKLTERPSPGNQPKQAGIVYWSNWLRAHHQNYWQIPVISSKKLQDQWGELVETSSGCQQHQSTALKPHHVAELQYLVII